MYDRRFSLSPTKASSTYGATEKRLSQYWPTIELENFLHYWVANDEGYLWGIEKCMEHWRDLCRHPELALIPPFSVELLLAVERLTENQTDFPEIPKVAQLLRRRVRLLLPFVRTALHILMRPSSSAAADQLLLLSEELWRSVTEPGRIRTGLEKLQIDIKALAAAQLPPPDENLSKWSERMRWPMRESDGRWRAPAFEPKLQWSLANRASGATENASIASVKEEVEKEIDRFWERWAQIIDGFPALRLIEPLLFDQLRRALCWHVIVVDQLNNRVLPVPIFPVLAIDAAEKPETVWLGSALEETPGAKSAHLIRSKDFSKQIEAAHHFAVDTWSARNRSWSGSSLVDGIDGDIDLNKLYRSVLVLDTRPVAAALEATRITYALNDESAGLPIALGVIGMLSGNPPDATVWSTGKLAKGILHEHMPQHQNQEKRYYDAYADWGPEEAQLKTQLVAKLRAARAHSMAQRVIIPQTASQAVLSELQNAIRNELTYSAEEQEQREALRSSRQQPAGQTESPEPAELPLPLGIHPVTVPRLSIGADAALPIPYRKYRFEGTPDLAWAFASSSVVRAQSGYDSYAQENLERGKVVLSKLRGHRIAVVEGPALCGKSYAITQALVSARHMMLTLKLKSSPAPWVTFVRWPRTIWLAEGWRTLLRVLSFPDPLIERFLTARDAQEAAQTFVRGWHSYGPDILVLDDIEPMLEKEAQLPDWERASFSPGAVLKEISQELERCKRDRPARVREVIGDLELIIDRSNPKTVLSLDGCGRYKAEELGMFSWKPDAAWHAVKTELALDESSLGKPFLSLLQGLSIVQEGLTTNGLYLISMQHGLGVETLQAVLNHLQSTNLLWSKGAFRACSMDVDGQGVNTGPLLREAHGRYHVHPLIRQAAYDALDASLQTSAAAENVRLRANLARLHFRLAVEYYCPFLSPGQRKCLAPSSSLLPASILAAHRHLEHATRLCAHQESLQALRRLALDARLCLLHYYHDPSVGAAAISFYQLRTQKGDDPTRKSTFAYLQLREFLSRYRGTPNPRWLVMQARIAEALPRNMKIPGTSESPIRLALRHYLKALLLAQESKSQTRHRLLRELRARLVAFVNLHAQDNGFPFGELPPEFRPECIWDTWENIILPVELAELDTWADDPISAGTYCRIGDLALAVGQVKIAERTYCQGLKSWQQRMAVRKTTVDDGLAASAGHTRSNGWAASELPKLVMRAVGIVFLRYGRRAAQNLGINRSQWRSLRPNTPRKGAHKDAYWLWTCGEVFFPSGQPAPIFPNEWEASRQALSSRQEELRGAEPQAPAPTQRTIVAPQTRVYVGNLSPRTHEEDLHQHFTRAGCYVRWLRVYKDSVSGRSRGFAAVTLAASSDILDKIASLNDTVLHNRRLSIKAWEPRVQEPRP